MIAKQTWPNMAPSIRTSNSTSPPMKCCRIGSSAFVSSPLTWSLARRWRYYCGFLCTFAGRLSCTTYPCFCYIFPSFIVGLPQQRQIIRGRQNKPLLSGFSWLQFRMHGRHSISRQDKVFSTFESQSTPYKLQCKMSSFLTSWSSLFVWVCFLSTNQRSVSTTGLFSKSMFNRLFSIIH